MRKFLALLGVALILIGLAPVHDLTMLEDYFPDAEYIFYLPSSELTTSIADASEARARLADVRGEAVRIEGAHQLDTLLCALKAEIIDTEWVEGIKIIYARSPYFVTNTLRNSKINLQIAVTGDRITVATPLIYGGY